MIKKFCKVFLLTLLTIILAVGSVYAGEFSPDKALSDYETLIIDGEIFYIETIIEDVGTEPAMVSTNAVQATSVTKSKTSNMYNAAGTKVVSVTVTGTFTYNGTTASCTSVSGSAVSYDSAWTVTGYTTSRYNATAKNTASVNFKSADGTIYYYTKVVTLTCSADGSFS